MTPRSPPAAVALLSALLLIQSSTSAAFVVDGFSSPPPGLPRAPTRNRPRRVRSALLADGGSGGGGRAECDGGGGGGGGGGGAPRSRSTAPTATTTTTSSSRRSVLAGVLSAAAASPLLVVRDAPAVENYSAASSSASAAPDLRCLLDLPPLSSDSVRIYLCRHGQTENNRLHLIQGARIDPPLNDAGVRMSRRIGMAMSFLPDGCDPSLAVHSELRRARETAAVACGTVGTIRSSSSSPSPSSPSSYARGAAFASDGWGARTEPRGGRDYYYEDDELLLRSIDPTSPPEPYPSLYSAAFDPPADDPEFTATPTATTATATAMTLRSMPSLGEVDFGSGYEGRSSSEVRARMYATYGSWSVGRVDEKMNGDGETGRDVLNRAAESLRSLADLASANGGTVLAVSHSTYMRMLLAAILDAPLAEAAAALEQRNGCVNVLDVNVSGTTVTRGAKSDLLGGRMSLARDDFELTIPETRVIRINEVRHLRGLV